MPASAGLHPWVLPHPHVRFLVTLHLRVQHHCLLKGTEGAYVMVGSNSLNVLCATAADCGGLVPTDT